ncbi:MAG: serine hydrolase domain-containing protein, partial [Herbiconiux sp.]|nr:serine hydrolase domain-containing protein [Herbiconiux sp.]
MTGFDEVRRSLEQTVANGYAPGIVAGIRHRDRTEVVATGRLSFEPDAAPITADTPFRIASLGKIVLGVLALQLHDEGVFALDDPLERWLPEFAEPRVLRAPDAPIHDTLAAERGIRMRDLVTMTAGFAFPWPDTPLTHAMAEAAVASGPRPAQLPPEEFVSRLAALPLARQPGERFSYDTAADVLSIALPRAAGSSLADLVRTRIATPLALGSTAFHVSPPVVLPTPYRAGEGGALEVARDLEGAWERPPAMESLRGGLVSTVPEFLRILTAIADDELLTP